MTSKTKNGPIELKFSQEVAIRYVSSDINLVHGILKFSMPCAMFGDVVTSIQGHHDIR